MPTFPAPFQQAIGSDTFQDVSANTQRTGLPVALWLNSLLTSFWALGLGVEYGDTLIGQPVALQGLGAAALDSIPGIGGVLATFAPQADPYDMVVPVTRGAVNGYIPIFSNLHPVMRAALSALDKLRADGMDVESFNSSNALAQLLALDNWAAKLLARSLQDRQMGLLNALLQSGGEVYSDEPPLVVRFHNRLGEPVLTFLGSPNFRGPKASDQVLPWQTATYSIGEQNFQVTLYWNTVGYACMDWASAEGVSLGEGIPVLYGADLLDSLQWVDALTGYHLYPLSLSNPGTPTAITLQNIFQSIRFFLVQIDVEALERGRVAGRTPRWVTDAIKANVDPLINLA